MLLGRPSPWVGQCGEAVLLTARGSRCGWHLDLQPQIHAHRKQKLQRRKPAPPAHLQPHIRTHSNAIALTPSPLRISLFDSRRFQLFFVIDE
jgi:hypothetical protein